jgi:hypothetical protein
MKVNKSISLDIELYKESRELSPSASFSSICVEALRNWVLRQKIIGNSQTKPSVEEIANALYEAHYPLEAVKSEQFINRAKKLGLTDDELNKVYVILSELIGKAV